MELSVPIQFFIDAQQKGYGKKLQLFLFLKLVYRNIYKKYLKFFVTFIFLINSIVLRLKN